MSTKEQAYFFLNFLTNSVRGFSDINPEFEKLCLHVESKLIADRRLLLNGLEPTEILDGLVFDVQEPSNVEIGNFSGSSTAEVCGDGEDNEAGAVLAAAGASPNRGGDNPGDTRSEGGGVDTAEDGTGEG